jgi:hypothetical protein
MATLTERVTDMTSGSNDYRKRAPGVAAKLAAAKQRLGDLESQMGAHALDESEGADGASQKLAGLVSKIQSARAEVAKLEEANRYADLLDKRAGAAARAKLRQSQLMAMRSHARARYDAMGQLCAALQAAAKFYAQFLNSTEKMALATPTGLLPHGVNWHHLETTIDGRSFPAALDVVVAGEMFRHTVPTESGRRRDLPGANPPAVSLRDRPAEIEPATEGVRRMNDYLVGEIKQRLEAVNRTEQAQVERRAGSNGRGAHEESANQVTG